MTSISYLLISPTAPRNYCFEESNAGSHDCGSCGVQLRRRLADISFVPSWGLLHRPAFIQIAAIEFHIGRDGMHIGRDGNRATSKSRSPTSKSRNTDAHRVCVRSRL